MSLQRWRSRARAKAIMLSIWDSKVKESMRIDLWTKDMPVDEMKIFFTKLWWPCLKLSKTDDEKWLTQ
jgi:gliding motility-associated protein GldC